MTASNSRQEVFVNSHFIDWIWHISGSLALAPGQSDDQAFDRLASLFHQRGTTHERAGDTLTFRKKDQAAQDKMSVFDDGVLRIEHQATGPVLRYHLTSRALLYCFLAPLLFLAFGQINIAAGKHEAALEAAGKSAKDAKKPEKKQADLPQNPIDKALGAPAPKKDDAGKSDKKGKKFSPTTAYVFACIFAVLYVVGRILEASLIKALFKKRLLGV
jgi:hypothetical protein